MAWEQRGNRRYFYTAKRVGGRVVKQYLGSGRVGEIAAKLDNVVREAKSEATYKKRQERKDVARLEAALAPFYELADALTAAALIASGCHYHRGQWRRRREKAGPA